MSFLRPASMVMLHSQAVSTLSFRRSLIASSIALRLLVGSPCRLSFNLSALSDCISMFGKCNQKGFVTLKIEFDKTRSVLQLKYSPCTLPPCPAHAPTPTNLGYSAPFAAPIL